MKDLKNSTDREKSFCSKLTRTELILSLLLSGLILYLLYIHINSTEIVQSECSNPACYESIIEINNFIDPTVDPCEDFHQFACGQFFETAAKKQVTLPIAQEQKELNNELDAMILDTISVKDPPSIRFQKLFFQACKNEENMGENRKKILELIDEIGGWPLIMGLKWNEKEFDWVEVMVKCRGLGLPFQWFFKFEIHNDDINYLKISHPVIGLENDQKKMESMINSIVKKKVYVNEIYEFQRRLLNVLTKQKSEIDMYTIEELQEKYPLFNWLQMLNDITRGSYKLNEQSVIAINIQNYIVKLYQLLKGTPKRTQANYIAWKIVEYFVPFLSTNYVGNTTDVCINLTRNRFPYVSEVNYIKKYSNEDIKTAATEISRSVREEFLNRIQKSTWWNSTAGQIYLQVFEATEIDIGLQLGSADDDFLDINYLNIGNLTLDSETTNIIEIITQRSYYYHNSIFSSINQTAVSSEEKHLVQRISTMDIFFQSSLNKIVVPPSMLHGIIYDHQRPQFLNFATFGTLLAKEFIRSLQIFTQSDKNVTNVAFEASDRCFQDDYLQILSQSSFDEVDVVQEVLPDVIARDIAYKAYQNWVATNGDEDELPLIEYSPNQLFWIKSSLINCHKKLTGDFGGLVSKYKNVLAARHSRYFADVFGCGENTPMNPTEKC